MASIFDEIKRLSGGLKKAGRRTVSKLDRNKSKAGFQAFSAPRKISTKVRKPSFIKQGTQRVKKTLQKPKDLFFFNPKTLAKVGKQARSVTPQSFQRKTAQFARTPLTSKQQRAADIPIGIMSGIEGGYSGFSGADEFLREKLFEPAGFKTFKPQTTAGKIAEFGGGLLGYTLGPGKAFAPLEAGVIAKTAPKLGKLGSIIAAESATASLITPLSLIFQKRGLSETFFNEVIAGLGGRAVFGAAGASLRGLGKLIKATSGKLGIELKPKQVQELVKETGSYIRDARGRFAKEVDKLKPAEPEIFDPSGSKPSYDPKKFTLVIRPDGKGYDLKPKAKSRLENYLEEKGFNTDPQRGGIQLGPKPKQPGLKGQDVSSKTSIPETKADIETKKLKETPESITKLEPQERAELERLRQQVGLESKPRLKTGVGKLDTPSTKADLRGDTVVRTSSGNIVPPKARGGIESPEVNFKEWNDKSALSLTRDTLERNIEGVAGKDAPKIKEFIVEPTRLNETLSTEFKNNKKILIKENIVKKLDIKQGSKEDKLIQIYGEGRITLKNLKAETPKWKAVVEASSTFRQQYDEILGLVNAKRSKFGYKPIPKRADYFRHYQEIGNAIKSFGLILRAQDLPTEIAGLTGVFKPGKPFTTAELQRKGGPFTDSAIGGFENYIDSISRQIFHIDSVQRGRALEKYIREAGKSGDAKLSNFVANLTEWTNLTSGKKSQFDRAIESVLGRKAFVVADWLRRKTSANMVGGNVSSALTNFIPFTQFISTTGKPHVLKGLLDGVANPLQKNYAQIDGIKSNFLTRRFPEGSISPNFMKKAGEKANWLFMTVDKFTAKSIISGKYSENLSKGMDPKEAMKQADQYAGKVLADRSIGNLPNLMNTRTLGVLTQFQTEVNNQWSFITKDIGRSSGGSKTKVMSQLAQFAVLSYVFNNVFEKVVGRRPQIDPIQHTLQAAGLTEETEDKPVGERAVIAGKDLAENLPFVGGITGGRLPIGAAVPDVPGLIRGDADLKTELIKPLTYLLPPFGGGQAKKTIEGAQLIDKGYSETPSGKARFLAPTSTGGKLKALLFGKSAGPEHKAWVNANFPYLSAKETQELKSRIDDPERAKLYFESVTKAKTEDQSTKIGNDIKKLSYEEVKELYPAQAKYYSAEAIYSAVNGADTPAEEAAALQEFKDRGYSGKEIHAAIKTIERLDDAKLAKADREMFLFSPETRARKMVDRLAGVQEKRRTELEGLYKEYKLMTPEVEKEMELIRSGKKVASDTGKLPTGKRELKFETTPDSPKTGGEKFKVDALSFLSNPITTAKLKQTGEPIQDVRFPGDNIIEKIVKFGDAITVTERAKGVSGLDKGDKTTQVDHIIPKWAGGREEDGNYQALSLAEHREKTALGTELRGLFDAGDLSKAEVRKYILLFNKSLNGKLVTLEEYRTLEKAIEE